MKFSEFLKRQVFWKVQFFLWLTIALTLLYLFCTGAIPVETLLASVFGTVPLGMGLGLAGYWWFAYR